MQLEVESDIAVVAIVHSSLTRSMPLAIRLILLSPKRQQTQALGL